MICGPSELGPFGDCPSRSPLGTAPATAFDRRLRLFKIFLSGTEAQVNIEVFRLEHFMCNCFQLQMKGKTQMASKLIQRSLRGEY